jgi:hypothetical protein
MVAIVKKYRTDLNPTQLRIEFQNENVGYIKVMIFTESDSWWIQ